ncbi:MAG: hypothetical protein DWQ09_04805 [Proteobacteria bacterium]|nr:MAG: hypothetical protein DWQ09_04805 [Pseudomonadota bacterium]QKK11284.1 MAG: hypothetical protein HND59_06460 [Pseudomonadota bacterium]
MISERNFLRCITVTVVVRLILAFALPVTGDEAYFFLWARHLDYGYYDHPPMVAWWLAALLKLSSAEFVLRLPAVVVPLLLGYGIYRFLEPYNNEQARWVTLLFLFTPVYLVLPITTTDTPLLLFVFLSVFALTQAWVHERGWRYLLSGLLLGLAFLAKYFAVLLGIAYLAAFVLTADGRRRWRGLVLLTLGVLPAALLNTVWNYFNCWDNILFNLFNRNTESAFSWDKPALFLLVQLYLLTPVLLYYAARNARWLTWRAGQGEFVIPAFAALVPLGLLFLVSLRREVGLHWVLAFYPFLYLLLGAGLKRKQLQRATAFMIIFGLLHAVVLVALSVVPVTVWRAAKAYPEIVFLLHTEEVAQALDAIDDKSALFTTSYTPAAMLTHRIDRPVGVFGVGSRYARQDDMLTDFRKLNGKDAMILASSQDALTRYTVYFDRVERRTIELRGATFAVMVGRGFDYARYRQGVLSEIRDRYYQIPDWLPVGGCGFLEAYFPEHRETMN